MTDTIAEPQADETVKIDPDIKRRWVERLRSGAYEQTFFKLHRLVPRTEDGVGGRDAVECKAGYCCLGVLMTVAVEDGVAEEHETYLGYDGTDAEDYGEDYVWEKGSEVGLTFFQSPGGDHADTNFVPGFLGEWLTGNPQKYPGDVLAVPYVDDEGHDYGRVPLFDLNDKYGLPFAKIADLVEAHL